MNKLAKLATDGTFGICFLVGIYHIIPLAIKYFQELYDLVVR